MRLNDLTPAEGSNPTRKRVGRGIGSGTGKTGGRGHKGQKSRAGGTVRPGFEGGQQPLQTRLPKFGFTTTMSRTTAEVTLSELGKVNADVIDMAALKAAGILNNRFRRAKVMLSGEINRAVTLKGIGVTKGARAAIEAAGGTIGD